MKQFLSCVLGCVTLALLLSLTARAEVEGVRPVFMEPDEAAEKGRTPSYRLISDPDRVKTYSNWMNNDPARMAMDLYRRAWRVARKDGQDVVYYIALVKGGNHAAIGFRLRNGSGWEGHERTPYIKLDASEFAFTTTLLHETGHVILSMLNGGNGIPAKDLSSIPHTTAALTDRGTAFNEGFSIHLETLAAHLSSAAIVLSRYQHPRFLFGLAGRGQSEYFRHSMDLLTYAQTRTRYYEVRENIFAFAPAFKGPDYFRVQLEKSRDFATLRDANQLLQSEGFYATFFFSLLFRGNNPPTAEALRERQDKMLAVLADMFRAKPVDEDAPYLLHFVETFMQKFPAEAGEVVDVLLDLSHGVFVDRQAAALWRDHYLAALSMDMKERDNEKILKSRTEWRERVMKDPKILYSLLGKQIRCETPGQSVKLLAFGEASPLVFDINTVEEGLIRMIPGVAETQVETWLSQRRQKPFSDPEDFKKRSGLNEKTFAQLKF